jgi:uncharacterized protein YecE (DUF72 family)
MRLYCGTSGFSFKEWKGPFYPEKIAADQMLSFYAKHLRAVEINNTFYRFPRKEALAGWRDKVPSTFRFVVKASRRISHILRLKDCDEPAGYLFGAVAELGEQLGAVLVQLPPHFRADLERLQRFLELVPTGLPVAFEFRHESWRETPVLDALSAHDAAWVWSDNDGEAPAEVPGAAPWTYLRLRAPSYSQSDLAAWKKLCDPYEHAFVFFKHEAAGVGPKLAQQLQDLEPAL